MTAPELHVVIPAHDEAELLGQCLSSVRAAVARVEATVTVVADACTDATLEVAAAYGVDTLLVDDRCVGLARDRGVRHVLAGRSPVAAAGVWVAMTDADTTVPPDWLEAQLAMAARGIGLWVGSVQPDPASVSPGVLREWWARHHDLDELHVHGANLGFSADTFLRAGGFPPLAEHEDLAFVRAAVDAGAPWTTGGPVVRTSGRLTGRTPGGFAGYVRMLVAEVEVP